MLSVAAALTLASPIVPSAKADDATLAADTFDAPQLQNTFQALADRVSPSVVAISASFAPADDDSSLRREEMNPEKLEQQLDRATRTVGTGMIISPDGYVLTNEHVISEGQQLWITTDDRQVYPAIVVGSDPRGDLAVLKIPATHLHSITFASEVARRGQWTIAIGNPFGLAEAGHMAMSVGVVSATERSLPRLTTNENRLYSNLIQTSAQINPGSSGGPLFDLNGQVIGVNTAVIMPQKQSNGIGFALPITASLLAEVSKLREGQEITYGYIGVSVSAASARERSLAGVPADAGVTVTSVDPDERAANALKAGDIVYSVGGHAIADTDAFVRRIGEAEVEKSTTLAISRDGALMTVAVMPRKRNVPSVTVCRDSQRLRWRGMLIGPMPTLPPATDTAIVAAAKPTQRGVMVYDIDPDSDLCKRGLVPGTIITAVAGQTVADVLSLQKLINDVPSETCEIKTLVPQTGVAMVEH